MTNIEWTDETWNPVRGCTRVSPGCQNCYAERQAIRHAGAGGSYEGLAQITNGHPQWTGKLREVISALAQPGKWKQPRRIFVNSMSDLFHPGISREFLLTIFAIMKGTPRHTYQILTKRPEHMVQVMQFVWEICNHGKPLENVWLGVSVESQKYADERIPLLLQTPAAVRFLSVEPMLEAVDLRAYLGDDYAQQAERGICIPGSTERRFGDRPRWDDLENTQARLGSVETGNREQAMQASESRARLREIPTGQDNNERNQSVRASSPFSVSALQRDNSARLDSEPRRWKEEAQSSGQSDTSDVSRTTAACSARSEGGPCLQSGRHEEFNGQINGVTGHQNAPEKEGWREAEVPSSSIRSELQDRLENRQRGALGKISWTIVGGESGPGARPFNLAWAESLLEQCRAAGTAFFLKQLGTNPQRDGSRYLGQFDGYRRHETDRKGGNMESWPPELRVREFPKCQTQSVVDAIA